MDLNEIIVLPQNVSKLNPCTAIISTQPIFQNLPQLTVQLESIYTKIQYAATPVNPSTVIVSIPEYIIPVQKTIVKISILDGHNLVVEKNVNYDKQTVTSIHEDEVDKIIYRVPSFRENWDTGYASALEEWYSKPISEEAPNIDKLCGGYADLVDDLLAQRSEKFKELIHIVAYFGLEKTLAVELGTEKMQYSLLTRNADGHLPSDMAKSRGHFTVHEAIMFSVKNQK